MLENLKSKKGLALIITLLITAILVTVITEIVYAVHIHMSMTNSYKNSQQASLLAQGGIELANTGLKEMTKEKAYTIFNEHDVNKILAEGNSVLSLNAEDEQGRISLNAIVYSSGEINSEYYAVYLRLLKILELDAGLADALADWIDINDEPRQIGGETYDYYQRLSFPYKAKNNSLDSLEELLLIKGYTPEVYKKLAPFVTVYTDGKININTASKEALMALSDDMTEETAERVIDYRNETPFKDTADIKKVLGFETIGFNLQLKTTVKSSTFRVSARANVEDIIREAEAVIQTGENSGVRFWRER